MAASKLEYTPVQCTNRISATEDAIYVLGGRWTIRVMIGVLGGNTRFNELQRTVKGISAKMRVPLALGTMQMAWGVGFLSSPASLVPQGAPASWEDHRRDS